MKFEGGKYEMKVELAKDVPEIVVATPGRLMEMLTMGATDLKRVTMIVIDEAGSMSAFY